jgi:hypothetical protein
LLNGGGNSKPKDKRKKRKTKTFQLYAFDFGIDLSPPKVCRSLQAEGQCAMDGALSFVEQGGESKRPGNGADSVPLIKQVQRSISNDPAPAGQTVPGRHFLGYFFVAADKEVTRHKGEITELKEQH